MKTTFIAILILMLSATCIASDKEETKYEVTITVTYNAVSIAEAGKIAADALERHKTACKTEVAMKKVGGAASVWATSGTDEVTLTPVWVTD